MDTAATPSLLAAHADWCRQRQHDLLAADSPLGWIGLHWLEAGVSAVGSGADGPLSLPASAPVRLGELRWQDGLPYWRSAVAGVSVDDQPAPPDHWLLLRTDHAGPPSVLRQGELAAFLIEREGRLALRVKDLAWRCQWPSAPQLDCATYDPAWRLPARWQHLPEPLSLEIPTVSGDLKTVMLTGQVLFTAPGESTERPLLPMQADADGIFLVFRDAGSGKTSYGAGRFLRLAAPVSWDDGAPLKLDFNYAYNPPCAFTAFAACPLPPPENWLPFLVPVGEQTFSKPA